MSAFVLWNFFHSVWHWFHPEANFRFRGPRLI